jgi:hypothetical protein
LRTFILENPFMLRKASYTILAGVFALIAGSASADTGIRGLEIISGKLYASSSYRLYAVAEQTALPIRSIEIKIDDGNWTVYAGSQLVDWCEGANCPADPNAPAADPNAPAAPPAAAPAAGATTRKGMKTRGTFSVAQEGMHTLTSRATDILGNRSRERREIVFIDNTGPESMLNAYYFADATYDLNNLAADNLDAELVDNAEPAFQRNGSDYVGERYALHLEAFDLRSGVRTIQYRFGTGDADEWVTVKRKVQTPQVERDPCVETANAATEVEYGEDLLTMFYALIKSTDPKKMVAGWNVLEVRLQDMVYNCSDVMAFPIYYDTYKPVPSITPEVAFPVIEGTVQPIATVDNKFLVTATDAGSGIGKVQIHLESAETQADLDSTVAPEYAPGPDGTDPEGWHEYIRPIDFVEAGYHRIWVRVIDNVGNVCEPFKYDVQVVINPPDTEIRGVQPGN